MDWDDLKVFLALHRVGTVAGAAQQLGVSRSTVLRRMAALEASAGTPLLVRTPMGLVPTEAGERLAPIADRIEAEALSASRILAGQTVRLAGRLDVTLFEGGATLLSPLMADIAQAHPEIDLHLSVSDEIVSLQRRASDLAIRATDDPDPALFGRRIGVLESAVYGTAQRVAEPDPPWVLWARWKKAVGTERLAQQMARTLKVAARVDSVHLMLDLVRSGAGLALLPVGLARRHRELVPVGPVPQPTQGMQVWALTHPDLHRHARVRHVMGLLDARACACLAGTDVL